MTGDGSTSAAIEITSAVTEVNATSANVPVHIRLMVIMVKLKIILNVSTSGTNAVTITPANLRGGSKYCIK